MSVRAPSSDAKSSGDGWVRLMGDDKTFIGVVRFLMMVELHLGAWSSNKIRFFSDRYWSR